MTTPTVLVATWRDGLIAIADGNSVHELKGQPVRGLTSDCEGGTLAGVYRRPLDEPGPLLPVGGGLPQWLDGVVDTACIATHGSTLALADRGGNVYRSNNTGQTWSRIAERFATPSSVRIV